MPPRLFSTGEEFDDGGGGGSLADPEEKHPLDDFGFYLRAILLGHESFGEIVFLFAKGDFEALGDGPCLRRLDIGCFEDPQNLGCAYGGNMDDGVPWVKPSHALQLLSSRPLREVLSDAHALLTKQHSWHMLWHMKAVTIHVEEPVYRDFQRLARRTKRSTSDLIREAMENFRRISDKSRVPLWQTAAPASVGRIKIPWTRREDLVDDFFDNE